MGGKDEGVVLGGEGGALFGGGGADRLGTGDSLLLVTAVVTVESPTGPQFNAILGLLGMGGLMPGTDLESDDTF